MKSRTLEDLAFHVETALSLGLMSVPRSDLSLDHRVPVSEGGPPCLSPTVLEPEHQL